MEYSDEAGNDPVVGEVADLSNQESKKAYIIQSFTVKRLLIEGVSFSTVEFSIKARTFSRSVIIESQMESNNEEAEESFITRFEKNSLNEFSIAQNVDVEQVTSANLFNLDGYRHVILFGKISSTQEVSFMKYLQYMI